LSSIRSRIDRLEKGNDGPTGRLSLERILMIGTGHAVPTPDEQAQMAELERSLQYAARDDEIDLRLEALIAECRLPCGLVELHTLDS
jgi:hypothetical protein